MTRSFTVFALAAALFAASEPLPGAPAPTLQPVSAPILPLKEVRAGQQGQVWTVFQGTTPEPFTVEVTGIVRNALGLGKSIILCRMTDPRVQEMGAVAGMSGSPLYIDGKLAGALSYQVQRFETVRFAGFTPAEDMAEVAERVGTGSSASSQPGLPMATARPTADYNSVYRPLRPTFSLGGLSPAVAQLMAPRFAALGIDVTALGGNSQGSSAEGGAMDPNTPAAQSPDTAASQPGLQPGDAVSVALATGDVSIAGTGTVSRMEGNRVVAFGHPMLGLGDVQLPMCSAEVVAILPSTLESTKIANVGRIIGRITEDRLSAVSGLIGAGPEMIDVDVAIERTSGEPRRLHFQVARQEQLTPVIIATGVSELILGSNEAGLINGFRLSSDVTFSPTQRLASETLYAGTQGFVQGLSEFVQGLAADLQNPYEKTFPSRVTFQVQPLEENPAVTLDSFQLSRTQARSGDTVQATLAWRDYQGQSHQETVDIPIDPSWSGRTVEVIAAPGRILDELTGHPHIVPAAQLRSFGAYLDAVRQDRPSDGICVAVLEKSALFTDQTVSIPEAPASIERIAHGSDETRFQRRDAFLSLWERHILSGKVANAVVRRPLQVVE